MKRLVMLLLLLFVIGGLAQDSEGQDAETAQETTEEAPEETAEQETAPEAAEDPERRVIRIDSSGGTQSGNLRSGPIQYEHPDPEGIEATVSNLTIFAQQAELRGPEGEDVTLSAAKGRRTATFSDGVRVTRNRLTSNGTDLTYTEADGLGLLVGGVDIEVAPKDEENDPVFITAAEAEFDVDTDVSISKGNVQLENGNQSAEADTMEFEEDRNLGLLSCDGRQCTLTRTDEDGGILTITADTVRVLTEDKKLHAIGNVTVVDGDITSTGEEVFFDDEISIAEVIGSAGNPAVSVDASSGSRLETARIKQDIEFDFVEAIDASQPSEFDAQAFRLTREL